MAKVICDIYKSAQKEGFYLYTDKLKGLSCLPKELMVYFGKPIHSLTLVLQPDRKLANADAKSVLRELAEKGFYLQMPVSDEDDYRQEIAKLNSKLSGLSS